MASPTSGGPSDPSSSSHAYFQDLANPKLDDIKRLLESDSVNQKLDGMKRLIAMISKGRNVSNLFPNVVKNVVCPDLQVKQLVYMYLIHYAEFEQDLALLSINTFQKDLENPSPVIRSQALRVLTSIRLRMISHILILSVKRCVVDNSPYVRKTAAHAIPKIYSLDHSHKDELVDCIETLFGDNSMLVLGSAMAAYAEVCPERIDLIHPHFRKFCNMLGDIDEWGQIFMINVLTRYVRMQFGDPNPDSHKSGSTRKIRRKKGSGFYSDSDSESSTEEEVIDDPGEMDSDHRLFLKALTPLLQSRNSGVVVAVSMAFFYTAPAADSAKCGKALVRIVRNSPQITYFVLSNIVTMSQTRPDMFAPYMTEFFIYDNDTPLVRDLKLEILTNIATESNIGKILREFNAYVRKDQKEFVTATIQAIGKCAMRLPEVQDSCMHGLMALITNRSEVVVAESVVVIKQLLQLSTGDDTHVVSHLAKLLDNISDPNARASIIWVVGEYSAKIPLLAPDILRKLAASFKKESLLVKLQVLNLAVKLLLCAPPEDGQIINLLFQYVCNMAKFDMNYDVRDRARVFRFVLVNNPTSQLAAHAKQIFCTTKPAPDATTLVQDHFMLNTLSHIVHHTAFGYQKLPDWPEDVPDPSVRNQVARKQRRDFGAGVSTLVTQDLSSPSSGGGQGGFYSGSESSEYSDYSDSEYSDYSDSSFSDDEPKTKKAPSTPSKPATPAPASKAAAKKPPVKKPKLDEYGYPISSDSESDSDFSEDETPVKKKFPTPQPVRSAPAVAAPAASQDAFFGFGGAAAPAPSVPASSPSVFAGFGAPATGFGAPAAVPQLAKAPAAVPSSPSMMGDLLSLNFDLPAGGSSIAPSSFNLQPSSSGPIPSFGEPVRPRQELLKQVVGNGLKVEFLFLRRTSIHGQEFSVVQLWFSNNSGSNLNNVAIQVGRLEGGSQVIAFPEINIIPPHTQADALLNIKFASFSPVNFKIVHGNGSFPVEIRPQAGELLSASHVAPAQFAALQKNLGGFQEQSGNVVVKDLNTVAQRVVSSANVAVVTNDVSTGVFQFSAKTIIDRQDLLISLEPKNGNVLLRVNCGNAIFANSVYREVKQSLEQ